MIAEADRHGQRLIEHTGYHPVPMMRQVIVDDEGESRVFRPMLAAEVSKYSLVTDECRLVTPVTCPLSANKL
jgi:hypothetical protein